MRSDVRSLSHTRMILDHMIFSNLIPVVTMVIMFATYVSSWQSD